MSKTTPIRVLVVDDHGVVRRGLAAFLHAYPDLKLVGEARSGEEALRQCQKLKPEVVLMDLVMPGMSGAAATEAIRAKHPEVQVIALTSFPEEDLVQSVLRAGAVGYLLKDASANDLAEAIRKAHLGQPTLAPEAAQALIRSTLRAGTRQPGDDLTPRERDVLALIVAGHNNTAIAQRLAVSPSTVRYHVSNILAKLGVTSRTEAAVLAVQHGLVS